MRGRRPVPDELQAARGNPRKRKLDLAPAGLAEQRGQGGAAPEPPAFLVAPREREIFLRLAEHLPRRLLRPADYVAAGRWSHYLHRWIGCKETLGEGSTVYKSVSAHGELLRRHPTFKDMLDLEKVLQSLEDRIGLNPSARQNILRGLANVPTSLGPLFGDEAAESDAPAPAAAEPPAQADVPVAEPAASPLGFVTSAAGKVH